MNDAQVTWGIAMNRRPIRNALNGLPLAFGTRREARIYKNRMGEVSKALAKVTRIRVSARVALLGDRRTKD